jgi:dienelactone hydrolase/tetratricopeptide (TPR) repeat protein
MRVRRPTRHRLALGIVLLAGGRLLAQEPAGNVVFPNSGNSAAQRRFLRGIAQLHNFEYREAAAAFQDAERADPGFALPVWFEALTHSPILWSIDDPDAGRRVLARLGATPAVRLAKAPTPRERSFAAAIEAFYADADLTSRMKGFADSLTALAARDTTDLEASAFAALGNLMYVAQPDVPRAAHLPIVRKAIALASRVYRDNPRHPGAAHYLIHASDFDNSYAAMALQPAFDYASIAPAAEHAQHMPAHVFLKLGMWQDQVAANERAWTASVAEMKREHSPPTMLDFHDFIWLQYGYLQQGRLKAAHALIDSARRMIAPYDSGSTLTVDAHYAPIFLAFAYGNETGQWRDGPGGEPAATLTGPAIARQREQWQMRSTNWERIAGALMRGDTTLVARNRYADSAVPGIELRALLAERRGDRDGASQLWREAAVIDTLLVGGPPRFLVAREHLAALLLAAGNAPDAVAEYERSLRNAPKRSVSLLGLARAQLASGDTTGSAMTYRRLLDDWRQADADLPELAEARRGAARATPTRVAATAAAIAKQRVWFPNGPLMLEGFLFKPEGRGPFPAVIWNHGSERLPGLSAQFDSVAALFVPRGYVVFAPTRRGHGNSDGEYVAITDGRVHGARGAVARDSLVTRLLTTEQLSDQRAGWTFLKGLPFVDTTRLVVAGCSFGGIQTLLAAEGNTPFRAAIALSPAAQNWDHNAPLRTRLISGVARTNIPVYIMQPPKDASLGPIRDLGGEFTRLHKNYRGTIYSDTLPPRLQTHCFGGAAGDRVWGGDALAFLDTVWRARR